MKHVPIHRLVTLFTLVLPACDLDTDFGELADPETATDEGEEIAEREAFEEINSRFSCENDHPIEYRHIFAMSAERFNRVDTQVSGIWLDYDPFTADPPPLDGHMVLVFTTAEAASCDDLAFPHLELAEGTLLEKDAPTMLAVWMVPEMQASNVYPIDDVFLIVGRHGWFGGADGELEITSIDDTSVDGVVCLGTLAEREAEGLYGLDPSTSFVATVCED